jgi:hypothetical protein
MDPVLVTGRPKVEFDENGMHVLVEDFIIDLGVMLPELEAWAIRRELMADENWLVRSSDTDTTQLRVPKGFVYDGASLPTLALVKWIAGNKEKYALAGLLHDMLYRYQAPKAISDYVFWLVAKTGYQKVGPTRAWLTWATLRVFGGRAYRKNGVKMERPCDLE